MHFFPVYVQYYNAVYGNIIRNKKQSNNETEGKKRMFKIVDLHPINDALRSYYIYSYSYMTALRVFLCK